MDPGVDLSVEVFPPKTPDGVARLRVTAAQLAALGPRYVSVTCGAGRGGRDRTCRTVSELRDELGAAVDIVPHVTGIAATRDDIRELLAAYASLGIAHLVVVRGDVPPGPPGPPGDFPHASDLVAFIRAETRSPFRIEVAAHPEVHPEAPSAAADLAAFRAKVAAGADSALTQYFYNADAYVHFVESCRRLGLALPIVPGVMPITDYLRLRRFSEAAGVEIPRWLSRRLDDLVADPESLRAFGVEIVCRLCARLLAEGAPGLHFYTMNTLEPMRTIWERVRPSPARADGLRHDDPGARAGRSGREGPSPTGVRGSRP
jgi:methylenetetrahydrofolate reductase (NADPH)